MTHGAHIATALFAALCIYVGCTATQAAKYLDAGAKIARVAADVTEAVARSKGSKEAVAKAAVDNAGKLTSTALNLLADDKRIEAREKLIEAVSMLQGVREFLPDEARDLLHQSEAALVGMVTDDLKRVYELGDE